MNDDIYTRYRHTEKYLYRTIGAWLKVLLEEINYYGTILPRIPKKIQDSIKVNVRH
jgi:hypothetical protein